MSKTILVTGPDLDPAAAQLVADHGYETVHTPAYADSAVISEFLQKNRAEGIVSRMGRLDAGVVDNIDIQAAADRGIPVLVATGANAISVAEHAIALLLATVKRILPLDAGLRAGRWEKPGFSGREIAGSTLGLMGMGAIAQATGRMAKGLGLRLVGYDPYASDSAFDDLGVTRCATVEEMLAQSNFVSLHCPLTDQTRGLLNAESIALMPEGSYVINTARGGLIDEAALVAAIRSGHLAGAGLDTFAVEPPAADHPFFAVPGIVLTPHIGGVTRQAGARVGVDAVRGIFQILDGQPVAPERIINRKLLAAAEAEPAKMEK